MGAYLSTPVTEKETFEGEGSGLRFGGSAMQGWRRTMEDAHLAQTNLANDPNCAIFGVFDGHGGAEVAKFCQRYMSTEIQKMEEFGQGNIEDCLIRVFHKMVSCHCACAFAGNNESFAFHVPLRCCMSLVQCAACFLQNNPPRRFALPPVGSTAAAGLLHLSAYHSRSFFS